MSLFLCLDLLASFDTFPINRAHKKVVKQLKEAFLTRIEQDNYDHLEIEINRIDKLKRPSLSLQNVREELLVIKTAFEKAARLVKEEKKFLASLESIADSGLREEINLVIQASHNLDCLSDTNYNKYQVPAYKLATFDQSDRHHKYRLGSRGACLGFTYAMLDPTLSPYLNSNHKWDKTGKPPVIHLDQTIYNYQSQQEKPNPYVKRTRLTRRHFCADVTKQAEEIYSIGCKHIGDDLCVTLDSIGDYRHVVYLCVMEDGIRYSDANHGAYFFKDKEDLLDFYCITQNFSFPFHYKIYEVERLTYDLDTTLMESRSLSGKLRSLLTGPKYPTPENFIYLRSVVWGLLSVLILTPVIAKLLSINVHGMGISNILCISFILGFIPAVFLNTQASHVNYFGLLAIPHFLQERWYVYCHASLKSSQPDVEELENFDSSTKKILNYMPVRNEHVLSERNEELNYPALFSSMEVKQPIEMNGINPDLSLKKSFQM